MKIHLIPRNGDKPIVRPLLCSLPCTHLTLSLHCKICLEDYAQGWVSERIQKKGQKTLACLYLADSLSYLSIELTAWWHVLRNTYVYRLLY